MSAQRTTSICTSIVILISLGLISCKLNDDPIECGENEVVTSCMNQCRNRTCANLNPPQACPRYCESDVCDCKDGYRRLETGECVPEHECPNYCSAPNEVKSECYSACSARTCPDVTFPQTRICDLPCELDVCDCKHGFLRNKCGVCVQKDLCSQECTCPCANEVIECVNSCNTTTCNNLQQSKEKCPIYCSYRCECAWGFARDTDIDYCVPEQECCPSP